MDETPLQHTSIVTVTLKDKPALYAAYMPFVKGGGLFIPNAKAIEYGQEVFLLVHLMEEKDKFPVTAKVVWVTPEGVHGNRVAGIGVQFPENEPLGLRNKIETYLAGSLKSDSSTHTM